MVKNKHNTQPADLKWRGRGRNIKERKEKQSSEHGAGEDRGTEATGGQVKLKDRAVYTKGGRYKGEGGG